MSEKMEQPTQPRSVPSPLYFAAFITAFLAALTYFLGRVYLNAYYSHFGVAPGALLFSTYDYMFSSVSILFMVIGIVPGILWTYITLVVWAPFSVDIAKPWKYRLLEGLPIYAFILIFCYNIYSFFVSKGPVGSPYIAGFSVGVSIGIIFLPIFWIITYIVALMSGQHKLERPYGIYVIIVLIVYFFLTAPFFTNKMAERIAMTDLNRLPEVTVAVTKLPIELQNSTNTENKHINAKLLTINNGWAYFFDVPIDNSTGKLYSMQISDIDYIVYPGSQK
jgi:hypothetical protein